MSFPTLNIGDLIAKTPIVQGGMGVGISLSRLASAVAQSPGTGGRADPFSSVIPPNSDIPLKRSLQ